MSNFILCRGDNEKLYYCDTKIINYPFKDEYIANASHFFWKDKIGSDIWEVVDSITFEIDSYFIEAQHYLKQNGYWDETRLFSLLKSLLNNVDEVIIWYADFTEDIPIVTNEDEFFNIVREG